MNIEDLDILIELAQADSDEAVRQLGDTMSKRSSAEERLALLVRYREEYFAKFRESIKTGIHAEGWRNFQSFIGKLDRAIEQQREAVGSAHRDVTDSQAAVVREQRRLGSFDTLRDREVTKVEKRAAKREQTATDEHAARAHHGRALASEER